MLESVEDAARTLQVALVCDPDLRACFHDRQLAHAALSVLVEHVGFDSSLLEEVPDQVSIGQTDGGMEFLQLGWARLGASAYLTAPYGVRASPNLRRKGAKKTKGQYETWCSAVDRQCLVNGVLGKPAKRKLRDGAVPSPV